MDFSILLPETPRKLRRAEYEKLIAMGAFEGERVELLHGVVVNMSPSEPEHASPIDRLTVVLVRALADRARVRVQQPLIAWDESEPEPDLAVVPLGDYRQVHPSEAYWVIEVAKSSLNKDRTIKAPLYASSGFPEYWIIDATRGTVEVYRHPQDGAYQTKTTHSESDTVSPQAFPDVIVAVADIFA